MATGDRRRADLAPGSWRAVAVWAVLISVFLAAPIDSVRFAFTALHGAGEWIAYQGFAECGEPPPQEWITPKLCDPVEVP